MGLVLAGCPWRILAKTPMDLSSSSQQSRPAGWTANMLSLARFSTEWMSSGRLRPTPPEAATDQRQRSRSLTVEQRKFHLPSQLTSLLLHKNVIFTMNVFIFVIYQ